MAEPFSISVDISELRQVAAMARVGMFANLAAAVQRVAETGVSRWQQAVHAAPLWEGERDAYMASIRAYQVGPLSWVITSDYKYVEDIENGRPARDLKIMLDTSMKVRVSKAGKRYLIIPFRHNTPGQNAWGPAMPAEIYASARDLEPSRIVGHGQRLSGTGAWDIQTKAPAKVRQRKYVWGGRLGAEADYRTNPTHKSSSFAGMVKFAAKAPGGETSSTYLTFRVMSEGSRGWIVPAKPGLGIAKAVAESLQRRAEQEFAAAAVQDSNAAI
jgi:hypothetical protein